MTLWQGDTQYDSCPFGNRPLPGRSAVCIENARDSAYLTPMQWSGEGLIIGVRRHGESSVIAEVMVEGRGRHLGLVRGGRSQKYAAALQAGNSVQLTWRARLEEHLGTFAVEVTDAR